MAGKLTKEEIIQQAQIEAALASIAKSAQPIIDAFKQIAIEGEKIAKSVGGADNLKSIIDLSKKAGTAQKNLVKNTKEFNSIVALGKQQAKEESNARIAASKKVIAQKKKEKAVYDADIRSRIISYKRIIAQRKKAASQQAIIDKREATAQKKKTSGLRNLIKNIGIYAAAMFGLHRIVQFFTRDLLNMTKKLDSMEFSMRTIIKDSEEFAATTLFLSRTAINYGQDILTLTERYIKFRAAAMQSNMTAAETMKIFDSTAKAAAVLGLKTDEVNGVFLALEQMISKGKVTTEELRRQLGERLPGAMGIMADAMEVSISELDKMLKAGAVLSTDALPKFAVALEKAYGIESLKKVDNLAAAQGRLKTSWVEFIDSIQASSAYVKTLNVLSSSFYLARLAFADAADALGLYLKMQTKDGDVFRKLASDMEDIDFKTFSKNIESHKKIWVEALADIGIGVDGAISLFEEYVKMRELVLTDAAAPAVFLPFDINAYKKELDQAEKDFVDFNKIRSEDLKQAADDNSAAIDEENQSYEQFILNQIGLMKTAEKVAESKHIVEQGLSDLAKKRGETRTKEEAKQLEDSFTNFQNTTKARIELETRLFDLQNKDKKKEKEKETDKDFTSGPIALLKNLQDAYDAHYVERLSMARDNAEETINIEREMVLNQLANSNQLTLTKKAELYAKLRELDDRYFEWLSDETLNSTYQTVNEQAVIISKAATEQLDERTGFVDKRRLIEIKLSQTLLKLEADALQDAIDSGNLTVLAEQDSANRILAITENLEKGKRALATESREILLENIAKTQELVSSGFTAQAMFSDNAAQRAENRYAREVQLAGDSESAKLSAQRKYESEKRKIDKRAAISKKAQSAFDIILDTASAVVQALPNIPLSIIVGAIGAATLAATLSAPLPQFAEGTDNAPKTFVAGEEGAEAIIKPSGEVLITPNKPTVFSDNSFVGSTILPHDETQKMLANYAINQSYDIVDMSATNKHLKSISDNTKKKSETINVNGRTVIKRGHVTSVMA